MIHNNINWIDNTDSTWLIISDYLEDNGLINEAECIRDVINNPVSNQWMHELRPMNSGGGYPDKAGVGEDEGVGMTSPVGTGSSEIGVNDLYIGSVYYNFVGSNR